MRSGVSSSRSFCLVMGSSGSLLPVSGTVSDNPESRFVKSLVLQVNVNDAV